MSSTAESSSINLTLNQTKNDRNIVIVIRTLKTYFRNRNLNVISDVNSNFNTTDRFRIFIKK